MLEHEEPIRPIVVNRQTHARNKKERFTSALCNQKLSKRQLNKIRKEVKPKKEKYLQQKAVSEKANQEKAAKHKEYKDSIHSIKIALKPEDKIIILDCGLERVASIIKILTDDRIYVRYHKGRASSCRKFWTMMSYDVIRKANAEEIRKAELRG